MPAKAERKPQSNASEGPDYDLGGSGPNLLASLVGFGQKSGVYWAFNPDNGSVRWRTMVGPAGTGTLGGIEWGTATDGQRIYVAIADSGKVNYSLIPSGTQIGWGSWSALDAQTGKILWSFASGGSVIDGPAITWGFVYWGSGYRIGTTNNKLYAFTIPGH